MVLSLLACAPGIEHGTLSLERDVHFAVPDGDRVPVALVFQGALVSGDQSWDGVVQGQQDVTQALLDEGFAVLTPLAHNNGHTWWDTNQAPWTWRWEDSPDARFMDELLDAIDGGAFGPLDGERLVATGISSGGYMTSRMAVEFPERFDAVAIHSAAYMTCSGALCRQPDVSSDHPEVLFLHGSLDPVVPLWTMEAYATALDGAGVHTEQIVTRRGHNWLDEAPQEIAGWFAAH